MRTAPILTPLPPDGFTPDWGHVQTPRGRCADEKGTIVGTGFAEALPGTRVDDVMAGLAGHDTVVGGDEDDLICGEGTNASTAAKAAAGLPNQNADHLEGGEGRDMLRGSPGGHAEGRPRF